MPTIETRRRRWAGNAIALLLSVVVGAGLMEAGARLLLSRQPEVTLGEQGVYEQFDPLLGWRNRPGAVVQYRRREYSTRVEINSLGFRDIERSAGRTAGTGRIVALGDSFVEGYTVERDESVTRRAEAIGQAAGCRVEVINAGVHAYSTDQEALWFQNEGEALSPDVVIVFAYYNDVLNNIRVNYWGSPKPLTAVADGRLVISNLPLPGPPRRASAVRTRTQAQPNAPGFAFVTFINSRTLMGAPRLHRWLSGLGLWEAADQDPIPDELRAYKGRGSLSEFDEAWASTSAILRSLGQTVRARRAEPVLVYIPARFEISGRDWDLTVMRYGLDPKVWDRALVGKRFEEIARSEGWAFLDLAPALKASTGLLAGEPYFILDGHWNRLGHEVAARTLTSFLREKDLLPCGGARSPKA